MLKEKIRESEGSLSQRQCKWQNRYFGKSGGVYVGKAMADSQREGESIASNLLDLCRKTLEETGMDSDCVNTNPMMKFSDYSWHMQVPILTE